MRTLIQAAILSIASAGAALAGPEAAPAPPGGPPAGPVVKKGRVALVMPFENLTREKCPVEYEVHTGKDPDHPTRTFTVDRYAEAPRGILEDILVGTEGLSVVERQRVDAMLLEGEFGQFSGLVNSEKAVQLGRLLGADTIVLGSIQDVGERKVSFSGYGIKRTTVKVRCTVRVRAIDIATGKIVASKEFRGEISYPEGGFAGFSDSDTVYSVIENTLEGMREDTEFVEKLVGKGGAASSRATVSVQIEPIPANCDIEVDGVFVGNSPSPVNVPADGAVRIRLSKSGYDAWEKTVLPSSGLRISPELQLKPKDEAKKPEPKDAGKDEKPEGRP